MQFYTKINAKLAAYLGFSANLHHLHFSFIINCFVIKKIIFSRICQLLFVKPYSFYKFELGNKTTISNLSVQQPNYHPSVLWMTR